LRRYTPRLIVGASLCSILGLFALEWAVRESATIAIVRYHQADMARYEREAARSMAEERQQLRTEVAATFTRHETILNPANIGGSGTLSAPTIDWRPGLSATYSVPEMVVHIKPVKNASNDAPRINLTIQRMTSPGIIQLEAGVYALTSPIIMKSGIVLRGRGMRRTILRSESGAAAIQFKGATIKTSLPVTSDYELNSDTLTVSDALPPRQPLLIRLQFDDRAGKERIHPTGPYGQMFSGTVSPESSGAINIEPVLQEVWLCGTAPKVDVTVPIIGAGLESLSIEAGADAPVRHSLLHFDGALDCWVKDVELSHSHLAHIWIERSRRLLISECYLHHGWGYRGDLGNGRYGYGIVLLGGSSDCLVDNSTFAHLRHSMIVQNGAHRNVFGYNFSTLNNPQADKDEPCDVSAHGGHPSMNLFEGNSIRVAHSSDFWGTAGPLQTFYRNHICGRGLFLDNEGHFPVAIANVFDSGGIYIAPEILSPTLLHNVIPKGLLRTLVYAGNLYAQRDQIEPTGTPLINSLYLKSKPAYLGNRAWPCFGPDITKPATLPAEERYEKAYKHWTPRINER
jgi:hypothetical protein